VSLREIFNSFSGRNRGTAAPTKALTQEFRSRVLMLCAREHDRHSDFWPELHQRMTMRIGKSQLSGDARPSTAGEDVCIFLQTCKDQHFLDFIEDIFVTRAQFQVGPQEFVDAINTFLEQDNLPYSLTPEVWRDEPEGPGRYASQTLVSRPMIIRKDSELVHVIATEPSLELLRRPEFATANEEFIQAHRHYKRGEYGDCLTKCGSAYESGLKIVCKAKGWTYSESDVGAPLIRKVMGHAGIESFLEKPLLQVAIMRNELSTAHGAGTQPRAVSQGRAQYALNATAAAVLLIAAESGL
jgi:hypothetical protein